VSAASSPRHSLGYIPWWLLALVTALFFCGAAALAGWVWSTRTADLPAPTAAPVVLTATPSPSTATPALAPPTATAPAPAEPATTLPAPPAGEVKIGAYVQVSGTGDAGVLNLRAEPSLQARVNYVALEREVLQVQAGPKDANNITWWYLVDPASSTRSGWAAQNYLQVVQGP
jgi:hypothetical protein